MSDPRISDPHVLDQPWRIWASIVVVGILLFGVLLGILIIPVVQGRSAGIDMYTAICRALGILPGSPAQPQPATVSPPTPVSKVVWTPEVLQILALGNTERGRAKVLEVCVACHGEQGISVVPDYPNLNGQSGAAIYKQLHDYRTGSRANALMTGIANALEEPMWRPITPGSRNAIRIQQASASCRRPSCAWSSSAIPIATSRRARPATGRDGAAPSKRRSCPSKAVITWRNSCGCMPPVNAATTSMRGCESSRLN